MTAAWTKQRIIETLTTRLALAAMRGQQQPVTATVLRRLETT